MAKTISSARFAELIAKIQRDREAKESLITIAPVEYDVSIQVIDASRLVELSTTINAAGDVITYNSKQQEFISLASSGKSCILIGAAGTGKTTCMKGAVSALIQNSTTTILRNHDHKHLPTYDIPGIVICAFTRRATNNIRRNLDVGIRDNCITIHKLLEYAPQYYEIMGESGESKTTMRFEPSRNSVNPLPTEISCIIFEEASMIGTGLYSEITTALSHEVQTIFLGDIQQLPPVFGSAILGYKMLELPTVELTEVYRQALESPIIKLAHRILSGVPILAPELVSPEWNVPDKLRIIPWLKKMDAEDALTQIEKFFYKLYTEDKYNPEEDMILVPFNKAYGTLEINKFIANSIARRKGLITWEVMAGFVKHYFSVGDKVLYDREDAIILDIYPNPAYTGAKVRKESTYLDYWGNYSSSSAPDLMATSSALDEDMDIDAILAQVSKDAEDRVTQASHNIKLLLLDSDTERTVTKAVDINNMLLGYALTVHKAQGSEWTKVFFLLHSSHATMLQRELLYTGVTRAKETLIVVCEQDSFTKGIISQKIKGNTLAEKAEYFKGKLDNKELQT